MQGGRLTLGDVRLHLELVQLIIGRLAPIPLAPDCADKHGQAWAHPPSWGGKASKARPTPHSAKGAYCMLRVRRPSSPPPPPPPHSPWPASEWAGAGVRGVKPQPRHAPLSHHTHTPPRPSGGASSPARRPGRTSDTPGSRGSQSGSRGTTAGERAYGVRAGPNCFRWIPERSRKWRARCCDRAFSSASCPGNESSGCHARFSIPSSIPPAHEEHKGVKEHASQCFVWRSFQDGTPIPSSLCDRPRG
jgi:hypothetical protein